MADQFPSVWETSHSSPEVATKRRSEVRNEAEKIDWRKLPDDLWSKVLESVDDASVFAFAFTCKQLREGISESYPGCTHRAALGTQVPVLLQQPPQRATGLHPAPHPPAAMVAARGCSGARSLWALASGLVSASPGWLPRAAPGALPHLPWGFLSRRLKGKVAGSRGDPERKLGRVSRSVASALKRKVPDTILPQLRYLLGVGVRAEDLSKVAIRELVPFRGTEGHRRILHRPDLLRSKVDFYQDHFNVDGSSIGKMILRSVNALFILQDNKLKERINVLYGLGLDKAGVSRLLVKAPTFFSLKVETLEAKIESLRSALSELCGGERSTQNALLLKIIQFRPQILSRKAEKVTDILQSLLGHGFTENEVVEMISKNPSLLAYDVASIEEKLALMRDFGFGEAEIRLFVSSAPKVLDLSVERNLRPTLSFFLDTGWTIADLCRFPQVLNYSLANRIKPRSDYLRKKGYETVGKYRWIVTSDAEFAKAFSKL